MKWYGKIGYTITEQTAPGVWTPNVIERSYYGDITNNRWKRQSSGNFNDNINVSNQISVVADDYALEHCALMTYVEFMGSRWKISDVEVQYPRLILSVGGVYNG